MADKLVLHTLYRFAYGHVRRRLEELPVHFDPTDLVVDLGEAAGRLNPSLWASPEELETVREAIEDARAGWRPRW